MINILKPHMSKEDYFEAYNGTDNDEIIECTCKEPFCTGWIMFKKDLPQEFKEIIKGHYNANN